MGFPSSPVNNQMSVVNGIVYSYDSSTNTWTKRNSTSANTILTDSATIVSNTASTSTTTGALKVTGGAGITGNVFAGAIYSDSYYLSNGTALPMIGYTGSASTAAGYAGSIGYTGSQGIDGAYAAVGYTGSAGINGYSGSIGYTGSSGAYAAVGYTGSQGELGFKGDPGYTGSSGYTGSTAYNVPVNAKTSAYQLTAGDLGKYINITTGGVTVAANVFVSGDIVSVYNNSASAQTITQGSGVTMYLVGTSTTGNRTIAQRGLATILCVGTNEFVITGGGVT